VNSPLLVTVEEGASLLGISRTVMYELLAKGVIESVRIGRSRRIPVDGLRAFVAALPRDDGAAR